MSLRDHRRDIAEERAFLRGNYQQVKEVFSPIDTAWSQLKDTLQKNGVQEAYTLYKKEQLYKFDFARIFMGNTLKKSGCLEDAKDVFAYHTNLDPDDVKARETLGQIFLKLNNFDEAKKQFEAILAMDKKDKPARNSLGLLEMRQGNDDQAEAWFLSVLETDPKDLPARISLGMLKMRQGNDDEAEAWFESVLDSDPNNEVALDFLRNLKTARTPVVFGHAPNP